MTNPYVKGYRYGDCRLLGHLWHVVPSDWNPDGGFPMTTRCERCDIERRDTIGINTGEVVRRKYVYPDGYLFTRDEIDSDLPRRTDFRMVWLESAIAKVRDRS